MTYKEITELVKLISKSNLTEFKMKDGEFELSVRTNKYEKNRSSAKSQQVQAPSVIPVPSVQAPYIQPQAAAPAPPAAAPAAKPEAPAPAQKPAATADDTPAADDSGYLEIKSPIVGTFYRSSAPDKPAYAKVGDTVAAGDTVCIVEAMKLFNEIESEISGKIVKVMVEDAQPVEYDQVLFLVDPKG
jgi:acetyl-CoA carboxylase biotin carboxyl carrier protein